MILRNDLINEPMVQQAIVKAKKVNKGRKILIITLLSIFMLPCLFLIPAGVILLLSGDSSGVMNLVVGCLLFIAYLIPMIVISLMLKGNWEVVDVVPKIADKTEKDEYYIIDYDNDYLLLATKEIRKDLRMNSHNLCLKQKNRLYYVLDKW